MRGYGSGFRHGGRQTASAVKSLIIANAAVFVLQTLLGGGLRGTLGPVEQWLSFVPGLAVENFQAWRFVTYMFLHADLWHIGINMFILWMFGSQIEALWGRRTFLVYYFVCGVGAAAVYGLFNLFGMSAWTPMLGASGAVYGLLLAYGMTFPDNLILVFFVLPLKAKYAVVLFGLIEFLSIPQGGSVAHLAHLGGMLTGFLFLRFYARGLTQGRVGGLSDVQKAWRKFQARNRMRVVRPDEREQGRGNGKDGGPRTAEQAKIDEILDKISREGLQSLTDEEQETLRRAGKR